MKTQITVDTGGRVLIPKELRDRLGVGPGDVLELFEASEQITLKPVRQTMAWLLGLHRPSAARGN